jgi:hypothetical protein
VTSAVVGLESSVSVATGDEDVTSAVVGLESSVSVATGDEAVERSEVGDVGSGAGAPFSQRY